MILPALMNFSNPCLLPIRIPQATQKHLTLPSSHLLTTIPPQTLTPPMSLLLALPMLDMPLSNLTQLTLGNMVTAKVCCKHLQGFVQWCPILQHHDSC